MDFKVISQVFRRDLKRIFANVTIAFVILSISIIPCLYAWCGIIANWDPYSNTKNIQVGIVNEDTPAHNKLVGTLKIGNLLEENIKHNEKVGWRFVDRETAMNNLDVGEYYAVIVIPSDFSRSISDIFSDKKNKQPAKFEYYVNERQHPVSVKVTDTATSTIETLINDKFMEVASETIVKKVGQFTTKGIEGAKKASDTIANRIERASRTTKSFASTMDQVSMIGASTRATLESTKAAISGISSECTNVSAILIEVQNKCVQARTDIAIIIDELEKSGLEFHEIIQILKGFEDSLDKAIYSITNLNNLINDVKVVVEKADALITQTLSTLTTVSGQDQNLKYSISNIADRLENASTEITRITAGDRAKLFTALLNIDSGSIAKFMATPVDLDTEIINRIDKYGTGVMPFFSNIAFWIGGFIFIALIHTEVEDLRRRKVTYKEGYIARGMLFSKVALAMGFFCSIVNLAIGVSVVNPFIYILTNMIIAFVFTNIIYMLAACFKHLGKAIAVVLIILQIPGSSGMLPVEMLPNTFNAIHPLLPFTYGIGALRECITSFKFDVWMFDILVLLFMWLITVLFGVNAGRSLAGVNALFEEKLYETDIFECEHEHHKVDEISGLNKAVDLLNRVEKTEGQFKDKDINDVIYKHKKSAKTGVLCMAIIPQAFILLVGIISSFVNVSVNAKAICVLIWILLLIAFAARIIVVEFAYKRFVENELYNMDASQNLSELVSSRGHARTSNPRHRK